MRRELLADRRRPAVLPDDRAVDRTPRRALPDDRRLALIRDAETGELARRDAGVADRLARDLELRVPDVGRVVFDPAGLREVLRELALRRAADARPLVEDERPRTGRALVEREDVWQVVTGKRPSGRRSFGALGEPARLLVLLQAADELAEIAFEDRADVLEVLVDPVVGDAVLREVVRPDLLAAIARADLAATQRSDPLFFLAPLPLAPDGFATSSSRARDSAAANAPRCDADDDRPSARG